MEKCACVDTRAARAYPTFPQVPPTPYPNVKMAHWLGQWLPINIKKFRSEWDDAFWHGVTSDIDHMMRTFPRVN
jgi:hypothetical protein